MPTANHTPGWYVNTASTHLVCSGPDPKGTRARARPSAGGSILVQADASIINLMIITNFKLQQWQSPAIRKIRKCFVPLTTFHICFVETVKRSYNLLELV